MQKLTNELITAVAPQAETPICVTWRSEASCSVQIMLQGGSTTPALPEGPSPDYNRKQNGLYSRTTTFLKERKKRK